MLHTKQKDEIYVAVATISFHFLWKEITKLKHNWNKKFLWSTIFFFYSFSSCFYLRNFCWVTWIIYFLICILVMPVVLFSKWPPHTKWTKRTMLDSDQSLFLWPLGWIANTWWGQWLYIEFCDIWWTNLFVIYFVFRVQIGHKGSMQAAIILLHGSI